jgi:cyclic pyranopterin phosphate synthase
MTSHKRKPRLTHLTREGDAHMVDVTTKGVSVRTAVADGSVRMSAEAFQQMTAGQARKGDVLGTARLAGVMGAKRTADLIPLCHPLPLTHAEVTLVPDAALPGVRITATARCEGRTGVEMEALTAVSIAALSVYDMLKAVDRGMTIEGIALKSKTGGQRGAYQRA